MHPQRQRNFLAHAKINSDLRTRTHLQEAVRCNILGCWGLHEMKGNIAGRCGLNVFRLNSTQYGYPGPVLFASTRRNTVTPARCGLTTNFPSARRNAPPTQRQENPTHDPLLRSPSSSPRETYSRPCHRRDRRSREFKLYVNLVVTIWWCRVQYLLSSAAASN